MTDDPRLSLVPRAGAAATGARTPGAEADRTARWRSGGAAAVLATVAAAWLLALVSGCAADPRVGWSSSPLHDPSFNTVAVPIARNATFDRSVHLELTEAIIKQIESRTPWRVVSEARARTVLDVTVRRVDLEQLSRSRGTGLAEETAISIVVDFDWTRIDTGDRLAAREDFAAAALFVPSPPAGERIDLGRFDAVERAAEGIVDAMQSDW